MTRSQSPSCHSVSVKWHQFGADAPEPLQAPAHVQALFHNDRLLVYSFIPHCTQVKRHIVCFTVGRAMYFASDFLFCQIFLPLPLPRIICWQIFSFWKHSGWFTRGPGKPFNFPLRRKEIAKRITVRLTKILGSGKGNKKFFSPFQATLCALIQEKEFSTMVSTTELQKTTGTVRFET